MKIAITGGTGFVGRNIARLLTGEGHDVALVARGQDRTDPGIHRLPRMRFPPWPWTILPNSPKPLPDAKRWFIALASIGSKANKPTGGFISKARAT